MQIHVMVKDNSQNLCKFDALQSLSRRILQKNIISYFSVKEQHIDGATERLSHQLFMASPQNVCI